MVKEFIYSPLLPVPPALPSPPISMASASRLKMRNFAFFIFHDNKITFLVCIFLGLSFLFIVFLDLIVFPLCYWYALCRGGILQCLYILLSCFPSAYGS